MAKNLKFKTVDEFLNNRKITDKLDKNISHTSLGDHKQKIFPGKYNIKPEEKEFFLDLYTKWIFKYEESLHLTEAHDPEKCPVLIDLDFRYENTGSIERNYKEEDIQFFIEKYFDILGNYLKFEDNQRETFILEKPSPVGHPKDKNIMKDGVHIIIPYIVSNYNVLHLVRNDIIKDKEIEKRFKDLKFSNPIDDIVDKAVIEKNNWFMYGSCKPGKEPYLVTSIIDYRDGEYITTKGKKEYTDGELVKLLGINEGLDDNICSFNKSSKDITEAYEKAFGKAKSNSSVKVNKRYMKKTNENLELIKQIVSILSAQRAESFDSWIRVGWCLHNIDYSLLDSWIEFSIQSPKFEDGTCEQKWAEMKDEGGLEIGTLYRWAKMDNEEAYKRIMRDDIENLIRTSLSVSHYDIAKVVYKLYKHEFKCVSSRNKQWYQFINHRWTEMDNCTSLRHKISEEIVQEYCNYAGKCNQIIQNLTDETQQETYIKRGKKAFEISGKLKNMPFVDNIIRACSVLFHDKKFFEKLDSDVNLIGFENGVYDLEKKEFREGYPDDYVSFSAGIDYETFDKDEEIIQQVHEFIGQVLPIPAVKEYVLKVMGSVLSGKTGEEKFHIWTGCHAKDTKIMTSNGLHKKVQDIEEGDYLMGPDSKPRKVLNLVRGKSNMYEITPSKGDKFIVNEGHIMVLENKSGDIIEIEVNKYIKNKIEKQEYYLIKKTKDFKNRELLSFKINKVKEDDYYGFRLDKDHLYLTEDFIVHHNCGGNGKSKLIELFEKAFGDYCGKMSVTLITQKRAASNSCNPELIKNKGKRFVTLQEPDDDEKIHTGAMKELTGGDKIQARGLFKDPIEFKPQWKIVLTSNVLPQVNANDRGTWRRIRVTEYVSRFMEPSEIDPEIPYQFPIDYDLSTKLEQWPEAFMWILIQEYHKYVKEGLKEPEEVLKNTKAYQEESDIFLQFIEDNITTSLTEKLAVTEVNNVFKMWFQNSGNGGKMPKKGDLHNSITMKYGPIKGQKWSGITIGHPDQMEPDSEDED